LPLLVIGGKEDLQVNPQAVIESMSPHFKICESLLLENVGHMPFYEYVYLLAPEIRSCLTDYNIGHLMPSPNVSLSSSSDIRAHLRESQDGLSIFDQVPGTGAIYLLSSPAEIPPGVAHRNMRNTASSLSLITYNIYKTCASTSLTMLHV
jgi:hypothetical protein